MRSVLALLVAVAMVAGALYFRYGRPGGDGGDGLLTPDEPLTVVCSTDLGTVCDALADEGIQVREELAADTGESLSSAGAGDETESADAPDAWLVEASWPQVVDDTRTRNGLPAAFSDTGAPLARSPVVLAMFSERAAALDCAGDTVDWDCLGRVAGRPWVDVGGQQAWGRVKPAHDHPDRGAGLVVLGAIAANRLGRSDFNSRDLQSDEFFGWFSRLEGAAPAVVPFGHPAIRDMVAFGPSFYDAVGTVEAFAAPLMQTQRAGNVTLLYPEPVVTADIVLAPLAEGAGGEALGDAADVARQALAQAGWRVEGGTAAPGVPSEPALPSASQAPPAGSLEALRALWDEVT